MTYYHCPETFRRKPYGCGFGPVNAMEALYDQKGVCPKCGKKLKKVRSTPRKRMAAIQQHLDAAGTAEEVGGKGAGTRYLSTHKPRK